MRNASARSPSPLTGSKQLWKPTPCCLITACFPTGNNVSLSFLHSRTPLLLVLIALLPNLCPIVLVEASLHNISKSPLENINQLALISLPARDSPVLS